MCAAPQSLQSASTLVAGPLQSCKVENTMPTIQKRKQRLWEVSLPSAM